MKKIFLLASLAIMIALGISALPAATKAEGMSTKLSEDMGTKLSGRILIAVQANGETWYVNPINQQRYFLGQPLDAFSIMQQLGLGISNSDFDSYNGTAPMRLSGLILLKVQSHGEAYYVNPVDLKMHYLGTPSQALALMRSLSLGITNVDLNKMAIQENWNISINDSTFSPKVLTVKKGAMVTWTNNENTSHTVTSLNNFNFGEIAPGKTYSRMFNVVGTYNYYSLNQSSMTGTIIVQ
ncbi:MAG: cupredoxin domain-containing protein [Patescibacteria group bacterium]